MATIKSYTDLEQSKKLAKILPLESADMWWNFYSVTTDNTTPLIIHLDTPWVGNFNWDNKPDNVPCWSLAALLQVLPDTMLGKDKDGYVVMVETMGSGLTTFASNPIDACYEMIIKLNEQKML